VKLSDTPGQITHGAPPLGADSAAVLRDLLGLSEAEIERLESAGVIKPADQPV
jgi:crotonobetainyl-CoA:carnitine CoA-transferase CaiB-like acyl-CoA transferase